MFFTYSMSHAMYSYCTPLKQPSHLSGLGAITVTPHSKEVLDVSGTTFTISCVISGLSQAATTVEWEKDLAVISSGGGFTPDVGSDSYTAGTQTTTLSVAGSDTTRADMLFTCKVTNPTDGDTVVTAEVNLNFYSKYLTT